MVGPKQAPITKPRKHAKPGSLCNPTQGNGDLTPIQPITHWDLRSSFTSLLTHVWSSLAGSSQHSPCSLLDQFACGLPSKQLSSL